MARKFPVDSAGPDIVRDYIITTLIRKHEATPEYAEKLATSWQLGRVRELRSATLKHLQDDFGNDVGLCIYRSIREDMLEDWQETTAAAVTICSLPLAYSITVVMEINNVSLRDCVYRDDDPSCGCRIVHPTRIGTHATLWYAPFRSKILIRSTSLTVISALERIRVAKSPASWLLFGFAWLNYHYQRQDIEEPGHISLAGPVGLLSISVGLYLFSM